MLVYHFLLWFPGVKFFFTLWFVTFTCVGHLTARSDIYSFGVVLLEMMTGRRVMDKNRPHGEQNLIEWAKPFLSSKRKVLRIMDPRIEGQYSVEGALKAALLAVKCLALEPKFRPKMHEVVKALEQLQNSNESGSLKRDQTQRKHRRTCTDEASRRKTSSYPRPAASPQLVTWIREWMTTALTIYTTWNERKRWDMLDWIFGN